ncbi:MAG: methyltransferase [Pseudomonadota bacterium]
MQGALSESPALPLTEDRFYDSRLVVRQYRDGYRFSIDAVLLADFARPWLGRTVVELGTGCGIVALLMAIQAPDARIFALEIQPQMALLASENVALNNLKERISILRRDLKTVSSADFNPVVDTVVCNPPYYPLGAGRLNPNDQRAQARHELRATLADIIDAARRTVKKSGSLVMIYPAERTGALLGAMRSGGIEPKDLRCIHATADGDAQLVMVRGRLGTGAGMRVCAPLILYAPDGSPTAAHTAICGRAKHMMAL